MWLVAAATKAVQAVGSLRPVADLRRLVASTPIEYDHWQSGGVHEFDESVSPRISAAAVG